MHMAKPLGRPTKFNDAVARIILEQLKDVPIEKFACSIAKIHPDTLENWKEANPIFSLEVESAKAIGQRKSIQKLDDKDPHKILLASDYNTWKQRTENQQDIKVLILKKELMGELSEQELIDLTQQELLKIEGHVQTKKS
jgi:hypothetical protein